MRNGSCLLIACLALLFLGRACEHPVTECCSLDAPRDPVTPPPRVRRAPAARPPRASVPLSFRYVSDLVDGLVALMNGNYSLPVNLGNPDEYTMLQFAEKIKELTGSDSEIIHNPMCVNFDCFGPFLFLGHFSLLFYSTTPHVGCCALRSAHACRVLIGACDPM